MEGTVAMIAFVSDDDLADAIDPPDNFDNFPDDCVISEIGKVGSS